MSQQQPPRDTGHEGAPPSWAEGPVRPSWAEPIRRNDYPSVFGLSILTLLMTPLWPSLILMINHTTRVINEYPEGTYDLRGVRRVRVMAWVFLLLGAGFIATQIWFRVLN